MKNLIIRTITGAIYVAAIIASAILSPHAFAALFLIMAVLGMSEFQRLLVADYNLVKALPGLFIGFLVYGIITLYSFAYIEANVLWLIFPLITLLASTHLFIDKDKAIQWMTTDITGIVMVIFPLSLLKLLLNPWMIPGYHTAWFVLGMLFILWTHDTFAYLTGSMFGKHPLYKSISPKKSWEGSIGGFGFAIIAAYIISVFSPELQMWHWMVIALIVTVFGTIGDLAESWLKRRADVKDSGKLLPGHGGILDRVDSLLFISPMVFIFILLCCL